MVKALLLINASGGLMCYTARDRSLEKETDIDKVLALSSTIYTALEILVEIGICKPEGRYRKVHLLHERASVTILRGATRITFAVLHSNSTPREKVEKLVDKVYQRYIDTILYDPFYTVEDRVDSSIFSDIFEER